MKTLLLVAATLTLYALSGTAAFAQKNEKGVAEAVEKLRKAMIDPTEANLNELVSDKLTYGHSGGKIEDKAEFIRALVSNESDFKTIDLTEQKIEIIDNTALVRHVLTAVTANKGVPATAHIGILLVWVYQKGAWKMVARQAVKV
ncbi:nuclear transport factor 2 family protein [Fibrivirga algicola]|uniref:Nuclear transport factor 2 family protein n=1 Tax=Fibrivirga algicola TaxID=2950420 RepID=A0ABX0QCE2_9BACT|nr:nuclear transport factor 2 family protein [Fibrivirga algicola]NID10025.1 nuclear transport factor 2 family protein [Fibrivirga algicola]